MDNKDDLVKNLLPALEQLSYASKKILSDVNLDGIVQVQNMLSESVKSMGLSTENLTCEVSGLKRYSDLQLRISDMYMKNIVRSGVLHEFSEAQIKQMATLQSTTSLIANLFKENRLFRDLERNWATVNISSFLNTLQKSVELKEICMPDIFFLKSTDVLKDFETELRIPKGLRTDLKNLNKSSAIRLAANNNITFVREKHAFVNDLNSTIRASVSEMNVICGAEEVLDKGNVEHEALTENELMDFMSFLDNQETMAMKNEVGCKIYDIIKNFSNVISFDKEYYYHCRARKKDEAPYVWNQMRRAPYGVTYPGRYNHAGQAYFYFADTKEGAENEIKKHMSKEDKEEKVLQTVKLTHKGDVKLIDLSSKNLRGLTVFLKYIRFSLDQGNCQRPREYLIPSFVSDCCVNCGYAGIKYYGGKEYSNYVTWEDSYFDPEQYL